MKMWLTITEPWWTTWALHLDLYVPLSYFPFWVQLLIFPLFSKENASASIFTGEEELFAFDRTVSRLSEMQTREYWEQWEKHKWEVSGNHFSAVE
jgi:hypothetical protein